MKLRSLLLLAVSAVLGLVAIGLIRGMTPQTVIMPVAQSVEMKKVVVAATLLRFGDKIASNVLRVADYLPASVPEGAFSDPAELTTGEPRVVLETIQPGEPVLAARISGQGGKASLSTVIDPLKRALSIRVDDVSGAAGFITPGDRVDVMLTRPADEGHSQITDILLQNIKVLAIDQEANEHKEKPTVVKAVTLEVSPDQAQKLALGRTIGALSLSLRNLVSGTDVVPRSISVEDLMDRPKRPHEPGRSRPTIEILRGTTATPYEVPGGQSDANRPAARTKSVAERH